MKKETCSLNDFKQLWLWEIKHLYPSSFIRWHAGSIQSSDPVLDVRDLGDKQSTLQLFLVLQNKSSMPAKLNSVSVWVFFLPGSGRSGRRQLLVLPGPPARTARLLSLWSFPLIPPLGGTTSPPGSPSQGLSTGEIWHCEVWNDMQQRLQPSSESWSNSRLNIKSH